MADSRETTPNYEHLQDKMDAGYRKAWDEAPVSFLRHADALGIGPALDGVSKALPLEEGVTAVSHEEDIADSIDDEVDRIIEKLGGSHELLIKAVVEVKETENRAKHAASENRKQAEFLEGLLAKKQGDALNDLPMEEIQKRLAELRAA